MRLSRHVWWLYLALMVPVSIAYLAGPLNAGPVFNAIGFSGCIAIVVGVRIHRPAARWAWYLVALAQALFVAGDVLAYNYTAFFHVPLPFPSIADPLYLAVYPVTVAGLLLLIRRRSPGRDWASLLDAAIVTIGLGLLSWVFLMAPYAHDASLHLGTKLVSIAYPLGDILILGVAVRMAVGSGRRSPAYHMIIAAVVAVLATDSVYGWILLHGSYHPGDPLDGGWIVYYLLWGAAALHPSMTTVSQAAAPKATLTRVRILGIAAAALIAPAVEVVKASSRGDSDDIVVGCAAIVLFALVVLRMIGLARDQEAAAARERTMRQAAVAFVAATSEAEIVRAAERAAAVLAGPAARSTVLQVTEREGELRLVGTDPGGGAAELEIQLALVAPDLIDQLHRRVAVELRGADTLDALSPGLRTTPVFAAPILVQSRLAGVVALLDARAASNPTRNSLETLAAQIGFALESAALNEKLGRTRSEARLSGLVSHSADLILVITADAIVEYASPSIQRILGYDAAEFVGRALVDSIADEDVMLFEPALAALLTSAVETSQAFEFRIRHRDGRQLYTECLMTNLLASAAVGGIVVNMRDITERKQFEEQLTYQAFHDPITNLANRALFRDRVEHALSRRRDDGPQPVVLFLDLDDFKAINDTFGHAAGDRLLAVISSRLRSAVRASDTVARLGGDEFAIMLEGVARETGVSEIVEQLLAVVGLPVKLDDREVSVQCSIGIAVAQSTSESGPATRVDELLRDADVAMYHAKVSGGNSYRHFIPAMHEVVVEQLALRADLKAAIEAQELTLAYQPIFDLRTDEIRGYEALLRWEHAVRGNVSPAIFVAAAEDSGLMVALGRWVLNRACVDAVALQQASPCDPPRYVAVNISAQQLQRFEIVAEVYDALRTSGLDPSCLLLEITESMMIADVDLAVERLSALRGIGVRVAVDDFGTGYSSLSYIRRLPIDALKIDKRFIDSVDSDDKDGKLTAAIVALARVLDLACIAEGVERPAQHERLKELGCDFAQGFLLARPMTSEALRELLCAGGRALVTTRRDAVAARGWMSLSRAAPGAVGGVEEWVSAAHRVRRESLGRDR